MTKKFCYKSYLNEQDMHKLSLIMTIAQNIIVPKLDRIFILNWKFFYFFCDDLNVQ